jgi:hypothetical protein
MLVLWTNSTSNAIVKLYYGKYSAVRGPQIIASWAAMFVCSAVRNETYYKHESCNCYYIR